MGLNNRHLSLLLISFLTYFSVKAQTLYWVGGSGNFNNSNNWSYTKNGAPAGIAPELATTLIFDDAYDFSPIEVLLVNSIAVNSVKVNTFRKIKFTNAGTNAKLTVKNGFDNLLTNKNFSINLNIEFKNNDYQSEGYINLGDVAHQLDLIISSGSWEINLVKLTRESKIQIQNAKINFASSFIECGQLDLVNCKHLNFNKAVLKIRNEIKVDNCPDYTIKNSVLGAKLYDGPIKEVKGLNVISGKFGNNNQVNAVCWSASLAVAPSCNPGCDGKVVVTLPALGCWNTPAVGNYNILVGGGCGPVAGLSNVGPGTYTLSGFCGCISQYNINVTDQNGFLFDNNGISIVAIPVAAPNILLVAQSTKTIDCFGTCTGSASATFFGGTAPYSFTINPPGGPITFTSSGGTVTKTGLCAGILTLTAADVNSCTITHTRSILAPTAINTNSVIVPISCNNSCSGALTFSPSGGSPNYTVNFTPGGIFPVVAGSTVSAANLCPGPITATITDVKGCTTSVSGTLTNPPAITVTPTQTNITCGGLCIGSASVNVTGGGGTFNYTWSPGPGNAAGITGMCAGNHTVSILDNLNCLTTQTFNITQPASITISSSITPAQCNAQCNGSASVAATPSAGVTFTWVTPAPSTITNVSSITSQCPGVYTVQARDALTSATCIISRTVQITQPPALTITASTQSLSCVGTCTGSATATVTGGNGGPFTYTWQPTIPVQTNSTATNLCAGNYTLSVLDVSNCPVTTTVNITQPPSFTVAFATQSISCSGVCSGSIGATITGGTAPFNYTLVSATSTITSATPSFTGLCSGIYTLLVRDAIIPCAQTFTTNIQQPNPLVTSISTTSITCFNQCNGALSGSVTGGTPNYTLSWFNGTVTLPGGSLINRCAGNYTFNVIDANSCTAIATTSLAQPTDVTVTITSGSVSCFGSSNGTLNANVSGGTPAYTVAWSNGSFVNPQTGLAAGVYSVSVNDQNGCIKTATASVGTPSALVLTQSVTNNSCAGLCNGSATITASGGTAPFSYTFNNVPATTNTTGLVSGLCAGNFIASVTDANNCPQSIPFIITPPPLLSAAITGTQNSCAACTGAGTVTPSGGTPTYSAVWTNSLNATVGTATTVNSLCPGNYTVTVTDSKACIATTTVSIQQTIIAAAVSGGSLLCAGLCNASVVASPSGGTGVYNFTWTPTAQNTATATNLCVGNYTVNVQEVGGAGCSSTATINVLAPPALTLTSNKTDVSCFGLCNGSIAVTPSGGVGPYTFSWSPGGQNTSSITNQCNGNYTLTLRDNNNCTIAPQTFSITQPTAITTTFTPTPPSTCNTANGNICVNTGGGTGPYSFTWSPGAITASCITSIGAGIYTVTVRDALGCTTIVPTILNSPNGPTVAITAQSVTCFGASTGSAVASVTANATPCTYTWSPAVGGQINAPTSSTATGLSAGIYIVDVKDANNCVTNQTINIAQPSSLTISFNVLDARCNGTASGTISVASPTGGTAPYSYSWVGPAPFTATTQSINNINAGNYTLTITDANSCPRTFTFNVNQPAAVTITATTTKSVICAGVSNGSITASSTGGTPPVSFTWAPLAPFSGSSTATVLNLGPGIYSVNAVDGNNCLSPTFTIALVASSLSSTIITQNASCSNSCNASATVNVSGGTPTFTFGWSSGPALTSTLGNLCTGNYTSSVTDADGCVVQKGFTINPVPTFSLSSTINPATCGLCNGSISIVPTGAQGAVSYSWVPISSTVQNPTGLCAGAYTVFATDANNCSTALTPSLAAAPLIQANISKTDPSCNGVCNGSAVGTASFAVGTPTITWLPSGLTNTLSSTINSLCGSDATSTIIYTLNVIDAAGCTDAITFTLTNPSLINMNVSSAPPGCPANNNGTISVNPTPPDPSYSYTWFPTGSGTITSGLSAGIYTIVVSNSLGCSKSAVVPLSNSNGPTAQITSTNNTCNSVCAGAASIGIMTGSSPTFSWIAAPAPHTSTTNPLTNLCAGSYTARITDSNGCITFTAATVTEPPPVVLSSSMNIPTCFGICNGSATVSATGGGGGPYQFSWTPTGPPNSSVLTNACSGIYTVIVTHNGGLCSASRTIDIPAVNNIGLSGPVINNTCFGNCLGSATISATPPPNGSIPPPYTFNWSNGHFGAGPITTTVNSLCNGVYTVTANSANGCSTSSVITITSAPQLSLTSTISQPSCNLCNGSVTVNGTGGTSPYTFTWTIGGTGTVQTNLCAGVYPVTIQDFSNCVQTQTLIINNSNGITGENINKKDIACGANCNGSATVTAIGGNPPISYNWINPAVSNSVVSNLCAGTYFVQMQDTEGCLRTASVNINAANSITLSPFITPPACTVQPPNGVVSVNIAGGTPGFTVNWAPIANNTATLSNIGPGSYTITVTDASSDGCPTSTVINISHQNGPVVATTPSNINCFNTCTGAATAAVTGTDTPYIYNWSVGGNTTSVTNLCQGIITLTVTGANSCVTVKSVTITENPELQANTPNVVQPTCNQCNGSASINAFGGTSPYTYSWTNGANGASVFSLCAGLYQVLIEDNLKCQQVKNITVNSSNGITGENFNIQNILCAGPNNCTGAATVTPIGGTPPIGFNWINPNLANTSSVASNLCSGTYFVQMTDSKGCVRTSPVNITAASNMSLTSSVGQPSCGPGPGFNGFISVIANGGLAPYQYSWTPTGIISPSLTGIGPGIYMVKVTDANACTITQTFNISNQSAPTVSFTQINAGCSGSCNASIFVSSTGTSPVTYVWSGGNGTANGGSLTNVCPGVVTMTATNANGCSNIRIFTVTGNPPLELNLDSISITCRDKCDGSITLLPVGGKLAYTFIGTSSPNTNGVSGLCGGSANPHSFTVTDINGCSLSRTITLLNPPPLTPSLNLNNSSCTSAADGAASVTLTTPFTCTWTGPSNFTSNNKSINNIFSGTYTVRVTNDAQCSRDTVIKVVSTITIVANAGNDTIICPGSSVNLSGLLSQGAVNFDWFILPNGSSTVANTPTFTSNDARQTFTYELLTVSSTSNCIDRDTVIIKVFDAPPLDAGPSYTIPLFTNIMIGGSPTTSGPGTVTWTPVFGLDDSNIQNPIASNTVDITYTVSLAYGIGCVATSTMLVSLYPEIKINSGFSPNNDGKNDVWIIDYLEQFPDNTVEIYNRWGEPLFFSHGYNTPFDGTYKGKNLPVGTYYYVIHLNHPAYPKPYTGPLTIFR